ncbi:MAG TPA: bacteriohemerythrin [Deltaproteobacteria bacterium]|nr:bacteriohemerythrin [Deltaproteobacteria bacterium]
MPYVEWCEMFSIHVPDIDRQHTRLLEIANEFHAALKANRARQTLFDILNSLIRYAEEHFRDEEKAMEAAGYPEEDLLAHRALHEQLYDDIYRLHGEFQEAREKTIHDVELFLNNWLIKHILLEDKKLSPYSEMLRKKAREGRLHR